MCGEDLQDPRYQAFGRSGDIGRVTTMDSLLRTAQYISQQEEVRRSAVGFIGYGSTQPGDRVLIAVRRMVDYRLVEVVARALRSKGAHVDTVVLESEEDRTFGDLDEINMQMRREPYHVNLRPGDRAPWIEELAQHRGYDLLVHGAAGPVPSSTMRYEAFPWITEEHLLSEANLFPRDLHRLINERTWSRITDNVDGRIHLTDPEGTQLQVPILEKPLFDGRHDYGIRPKWGHLMAHPPPPIEREDETSGVICGTMSHYGRAFPQISLTIDGAKLMDVEGGGKYGSAWRELMGETQDIQYPSFPGPGLFWLWELAIGTNPKIRRPTSPENVSSMGFEWERRRAGIIHCGLGTRWRSSDEDWAGEQGLLYGHLHVHLTFPTLRVETPAGREIPVIERGRLSAYDDAEIRDLAARYGDPDDLLRDEWEPAIPGVSTEGSYEMYAQDPSEWVYG